MSIHPSLSASAQNKKQKSVLKRSERLKKMLEKGSWHEGDSVFGLPKIKTVRIKIKKEKAKELPVEGVTAEGAAAPAAAETQTTPKTQTQTTPKTQKSSGGQSTKQ
jgi:small basic protein (TIGR04137 family)